MKQSYFTLSYPGTPKVRHQLQTAISQATGGCAPSDLFQWIGDISCQELSVSSACARHMMDQHINIKCACLSKTIPSNRQHYQHGDEDGYCIQMRLVEVG